MLTPDRNLFHLDALFSCTLVVLTRRLCAVLDCAFGAMLALWAASIVSASASMGMELDAMNAIKREDSRRWRLLTLGGGLDVTDELCRWGCDFALLDLGFGVVLGLEFEAIADLLLEACV